VRTGSLNLFQIALVLKGLKQYMLRTFMFVFPVQVIKVDWSIIWTRGLVCEGQLAKKLSVRRMETGWMFREFAGGKWGYVWDCYRDV
jgi:hypothetical protein